MSSDFFYNSKVYGRIVSILFLCLVSLLIIQCQNNPRSDYQENVETELAKGVRNDSLFLGYHFGMTREEFFEHSWQLNKKQLVLNGTGAEILQTENALKSDAQKIFYPKFKDEKIVRMPVKYSYDGWAPWNRHLWADSLKYDVKRLLEEKYKIEFKELSNPNNGEKYLYHIAANKEIRISELDNTAVLVEYIDLSQIK